MECLVYFSTNRRRFLRIATLIEDKRPRKPGDLLILGTARVKYLLFSI